MQRREFGKVLVSGAISAATVSVVNGRPVQAVDSKAPQKKAQMYLAEDHWALFAVNGIAMLTSSLAISRRQRRLAYRRCATTGVWHPVEIIIVMERCQAKAGTNSSHGSCQKTGRN